MRARASKIAVSLLLFISIMGCATPEQSPKFFALAGRDFEADKFMCIERVSRISGGLASNLWAGCMRTLGYRAVDDLPKPPPITYADTSKVMIGSNELARHFSVERRGIKVLSNKPLVAESSEYAIYLYGLGEHEIVGGIVEAWYVESMKKGILVGEGDFVGSVVSYRHFCKNDNAGHLSKTDYISRNGVVEVKSQKFFGDGELLMATRTNEMLGMMQKYVCQRFAPIAER